MHLTRKDQKQLFKQEKKQIQEEIRSLVFRNREFSFHPFKDKRCIKNKESEKDISDLEAEEFVMRFFGLYVQKSKLTKWLKIILLIAIVFFAYFNWDKVQLHLQFIIDKVPFISNTIGYVGETLNQRALIGIFLLAFFVNLFFITFPDEVFFISYLIAGIDPIILVPVIAAGGLLGLTVDYAIGRIIGAGILRKLMKEKYYKFKFASDKWGAILLVFGNMIPSPVQWFSLGLGAFNYGYIRFIFFSGIGKLSKYISLIFGLNYYTDIINPLIDESLKPTLANLRACLNQTNTTVPFLTK